MRLPLITVITTILLLLLSSKNGFALPQGSTSSSSSATSSTDPCENSPCGKGAECKSMGSIAICVCPEDGKGDPFIACMKEEAPVTVDQNDTDQQSLASSTSSIVAAAALPASSRSSDSTSSLTSLSSSSSSTPLNMNHFVTSFDIGSAPSSAHQARTVATSSINAVTTEHPPTTTSSSSTTVTTDRGPISSASTTTTHSPYIFYQSSIRPATISSSNHNNHNDHNNHNYQYQPESHRIPIISSAETNHYPNRDTNSYQHRYPPMPITSSPYGSSSPNIFNEKTFAPLADFGMTNSYSYSHRGQTGHLSGSGSHNAYEYDSRPIAGTPSYNILGVSSSSPERYGQHSFHPASSGFPGPITESPTSRYPVSDSPSYNNGGSGSSSGYHHHHHSPVRNDLSSHSDNFNRISDPLGKYESCRMVNGVVVCADNSNRVGESGFIHGETTSSYGFHSSRDRDQFSSYYPIPSSSTRYPSSSSMRPTFDYNYVNRRNGYPQHYEERQPLDNEQRTSYYPFPKEQRISTQSIHTISSSSSSSHLPVSSRNDNDHHLCKSMCGINSICRLVLERPVCGCPEGHTGDPSVRCEPNIQESNRGSQGQGYCQRHVDCRENEVCANSKCIDPCKEQDQMSTTSSVLTGDFSSSGSSSSSSARGQYTGSLCGTHAQCLVVGHTPLCKCNNGYFGNPYVSCVP